MARARGPILLDNNAIGDAVDLGVWKALLGAYNGQLETVDEVGSEAGTYFRQQDDSQELMATLGKLKIHPVTGLERAKLAEALEGVTLDAGERDLWAHARERKDAWILCGPDKASLRAAVKLGFRERLVSLEQLLDDAGAPKRKLPEVQTKKWLEKTVSQMVIEEKTSKPSR